jgi:predicted ATPase with chaperone activity
MDTTTTTTEASTPTRVATIAGHRRAEVAVTFLRRLPATVIVGMSASHVKESSERLRMASGVRFAGTGVELAIAIAILVQDGQIPALPADAIVFGELPVEGGSAALLAAIASLR